jgi:NAD(P)-dependent dehydrogenase (short-subunit alcohol dehydrogenase family)
MQVVTRTAIVTGGGRGIGAAIAVALARRGIRVAVTARTIRELERTVDAIEAAGGKSIAIAADLCAPDSVEKVLVETRQRLGAADILVNNAGIGESAPLARTDDALWDRHLALNLTAAFWFCRALGPQMATRGWGRIINVSSASAERGLRFAAAYSASKAGLVGLTRALAAELGPQGVTVNAVCPGWVDTAMSTHAVDRAVAATKKSADIIRAELLAQGQQSRFLRPEEVAASVAYLASDEASAINGQSWLMAG